MNGAPQSSLASAMVEGPAWARDCGYGTVQEQGEVLSYGVDGQDMAPDAAGALAGAAALVWPDCVPDPPGWGGLSAYGFDTYGASPLAENFWPAVGPMPAPVAQAMANFPGTPGDVATSLNVPGATYWPGGGLHPMQGCFLTAQCSWWAFGFADVAADPYYAYPDTGTYAYRGRFMLSRYRKGFLAKGEIWACKADGSFGWDTFVAGHPSQTYCTSYKLRNVIWVADTEMQPGLWNVVPVPSGSGGSGSYASGFVGQVSFMVWGLGFGAWEAATGL